MCSQVMSRIGNVTAYEILDSRGRPTVEVEICLDDGTIGVASVPAGASLGKKKLELRDDGGYGVSRATNNVNSKINMFCKVWTALCSRKLIRK